MKINRCEHTSLSVARNWAASHELHLPQRKRKRLGQFFTGLPLSRLLAALSVREPCHSIIDPMAGTGDLLDAVIEHSLAANSSPRQVDAIEIDASTAKTCYKRLSPWLERLSNMQLEVYAKSAFDSHLISALTPSNYDLVITNPPYVRYQTIARHGNAQIANTAESIRQALLQVTDSPKLTDERALWHDLVSGYSGLSDLSVPSWLLAAMLVKPGGMLAIVAPATWRTRDYANVLQYMLSRFFHLEVVVADRQPGWFSDVLVRTNLLVARRLQTEEALVPLHARACDARSTIWLEIDPDAKCQQSLVGAAFPSDDPEQSLASWLFQESARTDDCQGLVLKRRSISNEILSVLTRCRSASWVKRIEQFTTDIHLFSNSSELTDHLVPHEISAVIQCDLSNLIRLGEAGIKVGQGLRTGCNDFFYVDLIERIDEYNAEIRVSSLLGGRQFVVPNQTLQPVLRRQSELADFIYGQPLRGNILNLRQFVLPEDSHQVEQAYPLYERMGQQPPSIMPHVLADHVRRASETRRGNSETGTLIPELSAVKTNVRSSRPHSKPAVPRFWYMLPDFTRRHCPEAFIPRINQNTPFVLLNRQPPVFIDANFSTIWSEDDRWSSPAIVALLNSLWAKALMESTATPMGGGALKLEATHLRRLPVPRLSEPDKARLVTLGTSLSVTNKHPNKLLSEIDQIIITAILPINTEGSSIAGIIQRLSNYVRSAQQARQRGTT